jgi:hypothetical protein
MLERGLITAEGARTYFGTLEPMLFRFPAIDVPTFRRAVFEAFPALTLCKFSGSARLPHGYARGAATASVIWPHRSTALHG